jgi:hypothetical protein
MIAAVAQVVSENVTSAEPPPLQLGARGLSWRPKKRPGGELRAHGRLQRCERNPQISDEIAPNCPQLSRSIEPGAGRPARDLQNNAKQSASEFPTNRGNMTIWNPGIGAATSLLS